MSGPVATRNTCFALISAIEEDFRVLMSALGDPGGLLPADVKENALRRRSADLRMDSIASDVREAELLAYIDFADIAKILESRLAPRVESHRDWLVSTARLLLSLAGARNRVCHTRPLEPEDLPSLIDFSDRLIAASAPFPFYGVAAARSRLASEPSFALTLQIPSFWRDKARIHHNLPIPEFDDTGFVGRQTDRLNVLKLLKSHYPVVTIVGEGGVGKTALALRCLYDIVDDADSPYDAIIWVSLKTSALTQAGVRQINGAITSTLGLLSAVTQEFGGARNDGAQEVLIDEIVEYMELYRVILAIDNLETISSGPLRDLLARVPSTSKVFFTSRIGIGEFEVRYPLRGLEDRAAISLFRALVRILGVASLQKIDDGNIKGYCRQLFFNPLLIKWLIASVSRGANLSSLMNRGGEHFSDALSFCFQNLFDRLGASERAVVNCLTSARRPLTTAELHFLMGETEGVDIELALVALHNSSIVNRSQKGGEGGEYSLSDSISAFVGKFYPPDQNYFKHIQDRLRELRLVLTQESILGGRYEYDPFFVRAGEGRDERICATYLRRALDCLKRRDFDGAHREVEQAKVLASQSSEVWRISALIYENAGDHYKAYQNYEYAVDLDPNSRIARYSFGMFLMTDMDDLDGSLGQFDIGLKLDPSAAPILTAKAMALLRCGDFEGSANIHEQLLPSLHARERRWRLTGADQAADCYRRWAHRAWEQKEYEQAAKYAKRAMAIILQSAERNDLDDKLLERTARILNEALSRKELSSDVSLVEHLLVNAERICDLSQSRSIPIVSMATWARTNLEATHSPYLGRLMRLDRSYATTKVVASSLSDHKPTDDSKLRGVVQKMQGDFGFILDEKGERWFFHKNFLQSDVDWTLVCVGSSVTFRLGQNGKGECAVDISFA